MTGQPRATRYPRGRGVVFFGLARCDQGMSSGVVLERSYWRTFRPSGADSTTVKSKNGTRTGVACSSIAHSSTISDGGAPGLPASTVRCSASATDFFSACPDTPTCRTSSARKSRSAVTRSPYGL